MTPQQEHRKWARELERAHKRENAWRQEGEKIVRMYRAEEKKATAFNILWSNTETLRPALYSDVPRPDVRRRFKDADPVGKVVSEVTSRALQVALDGDRFDGVMRRSVLDALLPGRGVSRIRYVPSLSQVGVTEETHEEGAEEPTHEAHEGNVEELEYEQAVVEHVDWQDFRRGYGRVWEEVQWVGFRCRLTKEDVAERFGKDIADALQYDQDEDDEQKDKSSDKPEEADDQKTAEFWEIWNKEEQRVCFFQQGYREGLIYPIGNESGEPPIEFEGFFPCPEPLQLVEDSSSLLPIPLWRLYKAQAEELERVSARINKLIDQCKARGIYDSRLGEISRVMKGSDGELHPVEGAAQMAAVGGLEKAVSWFPIEQLVKVLEQLYAAREQTKNAIYEITGLSDIVRGASQASETATAQQIKSQYASLRLKRMRALVAVYARQIVRMLSEVISEKFSPETLAKMTGVQLPTMAQKQQAQMMAQMQQMQMQQQAMKAQAMGQQMPPQQPQPPNPILQQPAWEDIVEIMRNDMARTFRVDVETDSMVASTIESDMQALGQVVQALGGFWQIAAPMMQAGALPVDAVKAISLSICRRARMGTEVEDAIDDMKQPQPPQADPLMQEKMQLEREKMQMEGEKIKAEGAAVQMDMQAKEREHGYRMREIEAKSQATMIDAQAKAMSQPLPEIFADA